MGLEPTLFRIGVAKMRTHLGLIVVTFVAAMGFTALAATPPAGAIAPLPDHLEDHLHAFVATVNAGDAAAVRRFRDAAMSEGFAQNVPLSGLADYFQGQRRVTGGLDFVGARLDPSNPGIVRLAVRDRIYGGVHAACAQGPGRASRGPCGLSGRWRAGGARGPAGGLGALRAGRMFARGGAQRQRRIMADSLQPAVPGQFDGASHSTDPGGHRLHRENPG